MQVSNSVDELLRAKFHQLEITNAVEVDGDADYLLEIDTNAEIVSIFGLELRLASVDAVIRCRVFSLSVAVAVAVAVAVSVSVSVSVLVSVLSLSPFLFLFLSLSLSLPRLCLHQASSLPSPLVSVACR